MTNLLFVSYSSKISSNRVNVALPYICYALPYVWLLTSSVLSATSKQCFEQPAASFLVCSLIFIEYQI
ncbi:S1 RNA-binding domain-containing protein [Streptococcus pneumoniae]|nr:S1 RNA-binding domain-containing protein [Streptococcus pneumoniae]